MVSLKRYFIITHGCQQNKADSQRIASYYRARGYREAKSAAEADDIIVNTCMIRQSAEDRVYGLARNIAKAKAKGRDVKLVVTGCMVGMAARDRKGKLMAGLQKRMPSVDEFLPIEEVGFDLAPLRSSGRHAWVPISNGCNNFCTYCVVPFSRGPEVSRAFAEIVEEVRSLVREGYTHIMLLGQNVNSYGSDFFDTKRKGHEARDTGRTYFRKDREAHASYSGRALTPTFVKHLGRMRIPTLFPELLREVARIPALERLEFMSSNPWDFSDDLINVIRDNPVIARHIHLPVQSGDDGILKRMNRWYTGEEYRALIKKIRKAVPDVTFSTDVIVGFPGETDEAFANTRTLLAEVGFTKAYVAMYSDRPMTAAHASLGDPVPYTVKKTRWKILEDLVNTRNLKSGTFTVETHR